MTREEEIEDIVLRIKYDDHKILSELAEIILASRRKVNYKEVKFTDKELKKARKYMEGKSGN